VRYAIALLSAVLLLEIPSFALSKVEVEDLAHHPISEDFPSGGHLDLHIRSAEIHIVGSDENKIMVRAGGRRGSDSSDIQARFEHSEYSGELRVTGGPSSDVIITVQIPKKSNLLVRIFAGDVEVEGIRGSKDIELGAGNLAIDVGDAADYSQVKASVTTGAIEAEPFGESRGGMFRSFEKSGSGQYKLFAHVGAGDLTLK
jgi:hypothetical protein